MESKIKSKKVIEKRDISDRKRLEAAFEAVEDPLFLMNKDHRIIMANEAAEKFLAEGSEGLNGKMCCEVVHDKSEPIQNCPFLRSLESEFAEDEEIYESKFDKYFHVRAHPIYDENGDMREFFHQMIDITERKKEEKRKEFLYNLFRQDMNNKLSGSIGYLQLIIDELDEITVESVNPLEKAVQVNQEAYELVSTIKKVVKSEKDQISTIGSKEILQAIEDGCEDMVKKGELELKVESHEIRGEVKGSSFISDLLSTVIKKRIEKSRVERVLVTGEENEDEVLIQIIDDGEKILESTKRRLAQDDYTGETSGFGGPFYFTAREVIENYDGRINFEDSEMGGAKIDIYLQKS